VSTITLDTGPQKSLSFDGSTQTVTSIQTSLYIHVIAMTFERVSCQRIRRIAGSVQIEANKEAVVVGRRFQID
jgi:hypothetical protein